MAEKRHPDWVAKRARGNRIIGLLLLGLVLLFLLLFFLRYVVQ